MANVNDADRLAHMLDYATIARRISAGRTREHLDSDVTYSLAIVRALEVIGEAASRMSAEGRAQLAGIPWPRIAGLRNRIVHGYDVLDRDLIWQIVTQDLGPLIAELEKVVPPEPPA
jgi:uncharacterized protein with HEPN domain